MRKIKNYARLCGLKLGKSSDYNRVSVGVEGVG